MDPCELRLAKGDAEVRALVDEAVPMFEFAVRTTIARFDLDTAEGRVQAMKAVAPIVGSIRDASLRPEYTRTVSGWLGVEVEQMATEVRRAGKLAAPADPDQRRAPAGTDEVPEPAAGEAPALPAPDLRDPVVQTERQLLQAVIQYPQEFPASTVDELPAEGFTAPAHRAVFDGVRIASATPARQGSTAAWVAAVGEAAPVSVKGLVAELSVAPLPVRFDASTGLPPRRYLDSLVVGVRDAHLGRRIADATASLRRVQHDPAADPADLRKRHAALNALEVERVRLRQGVG
jgi:DNA primase